MVCHATKTNPLCVFREGVFCLALMLDRPTARSLAVRSFFENPAPFLCPYLEHP